MPAELPEKLAREFRSKIQRGEWPVGSRLPTTRQLAVEYGVSVNTIQHAFRELEQEDLVDRRPRVGGFVKERVKGGKSQATTFGVIGPYSNAADITENPWGYRIIRGLEQAVGPAGFHVSMLSYSVHDSDAQEKVLNKIEEAGTTLGGVFCFISPTVATLVDELDRRNVPWVTVNRPKEHAAHNFVAHDAFNGCRLIGRCFARMGYESAVIISDPLGSGRSTGDKYFGFLQGCIECGGESRAIDFLSAKTYEEEHGYNEFHKHVKKHGIPRAVLASGDFLALGALRACEELGLKVPEQVAIIGATGLDVAAYSRPSLTVLNTPMEQLGQEAGRMLMEMAREGVRRMTGCYIPAPITVRESCPIPTDILATEQRHVLEAP